MAKRPLRAFFFDVDDTVFSTTDFAELARRNSVKAMIQVGLRMDEEDLYQELLEVITEFSSNYAHHFDKLILRIPPEARAGVSPLIVVAAGVSAYHETKSRYLTAYADATEVLKTLKERGLLLGIISAGVGIKQAEKIVRLGLHKLVGSKFIFITDEIGIAKSNAKLYLRACRAAGVAPEECGYIGDNPTVDVDVPKSIGMPTFLSRRGGKYQNVQGESEPQYIVHNFWDVLEIIENDFDILPAANDV